MLGRLASGPDKFQFAEKSVDFVGFRVSDSAVEPLPKYLDAIRDFPSPTSTTDVRTPLVSSTRCPTTLSCAM